MLAYTEPPPNFDLKWKEHVYQNLILSPRSEDKRGRRGSELRVFVVVVSFAFVVVAVGVEKFYVSNLELRQFYLQGLTLCATEEHQQRRNRYWQQTLKICSVLALKSSIVKC